METKPLVAIVGRPNVGKSTFFNKIAGKRLSIVDDAPGVTRDRLYADAEWCGYAFTMIDTGGIEIGSEDRMWNYIAEQARLAVDIADVILFFVDGKTGIVKDDYEVADLLRRSGKPIIVAVNKLDTKSNDGMYDFYDLGIGEVYPVSAEQSFGFGDLLDAVVAYIKKIPPDENNEALSIAIVGKPNAGKSSLCNRILGYDRVIVSDIAGTTRDAVDTPFVYEGKPYVLIDTAGIRRKRSITEDLEQYSVMRSLAAVRRADVVIVVVDASEELSEQDVRLCGYVHEQGKPSVIVMNKWDIIEKDTGTINEFKKRMNEQLKFMDYFCPLFISALTGKRCPNVMKEVLRVYENACFRVTTGTLNDVVMDAVSMNEPPVVKGHNKAKFFYATEVAVTPPTFVFFVNDPDGIHFSYKRYLENCIRNAFDFTGTPIRLIFKGKEEK